MTWDDESERWIVETNRGDAIRARFVAMANGPLHRPKLPGVDGIESFAGHTFHTSRWDYDYTGGGPDGGLDKLADKRVGIIGTGATAVQAVPHLGEGAQELFVFQRTPSSVDVRANRPTDPEWAASLEPGWHRNRMENFNALGLGRAAGGGPRAGRLDRHHRQDARPAEQGEWRGGSEPRRDPRTGRLPEDERGPRPGRRVDRRPEHRRVAEGLLPPVLQAAVLPRRVPPDVQSSRTSRWSTPTARASTASPNAASSPTAPRYELDCIVFATGFEVGTGYSRRAGYETVGRDGVTLSDHWSDGARTLHGIHSHGFPNCFIMSQTQGGFTVNYPHMLDELAIHIAAIVSRRPRGRSPRRRSHRRRRGGVGPGDPPPRRNPRRLPRGVHARLLQQRGQALRAVDAGRAVRPRTRSPSSIVLKTWRESGDFDGVTFG